ncbi:GreA/GreB family elongation factor [Mycobacterium intermedium]|nr:GreA/GreB family elongation factor [Mycobacterium intermedium]MCV6964923.1 GreA/GreB family elongation factor [Mycobacterium intermedium]
MTAAAPFPMTRPGEHAAGPGMVVTIRYNATGETETFVLGRREGEGASMEVYSMASPLGRAVVGALPGEQRLYAIPDERPQLVTVVRVVPYGPRVRRVARRRFPRGRK